jgi:hypothetical protein
MHNQRLSSMIGIKELLDAGKNVLNSRAIM